MRREFKGSHKKPHQNKKKLPTNKHSWAFLCSTADPFPLCPSIPQLCVSCFPYGNSMNQNGNLMQLRPDCTRSAWDGVNFLQSRQNSAMLWLWDYTGLMFYLLLSSVCTAPKFFSFSHSGLPASRGGICERLARDTTKASGQRDIPCHTLNNKSWEMKKEEETPRAIVFTFPSKH